jgi:tetratricopeptide (TPR) repeat protein
MNNSSSLSWFRLSLASIFFVVLNACTTVPYTSQEPTIIVESRPAPVIKQTEVVPEPVQQPSVAPSAPQRLPEAPRNTALISLLDTATAQQQQGDYRAAQTTLQRAQRIAPQDPEVYYKLAATHRDLEDYALAEQVALKGVSILQGRPAELKRFWLLLTEVYSLAGNGQKAKEAQLKAASY